MTSYIGVEPTAGSFDKQLITGDGSNATFDLDFPVAQAGQLLVSLDGIVQEPSFAFNISMSSGDPKITFAAAPANNARIFIVYLGRTLLSMTNALSSPHIDEFNGNGSATAFTLTQTPSGSGANNFIVFVNNVYQRYGASYAFTVNGAIITFTSAPPSGTNNIQVIQLSTANTLNTVSDSTITKAKLSFDPADDATALAIALG
tara:strand:+ start:4728 stop:5336 length:609 start_codon:yes stop_codon:yes gene_type:complete